jgi:cell division inhibitor SepF
MGMGLLKSLKELVGIEEIEDVPEEEVQKAMAELNRKPNSFEAKKPEQVSVSSSASSRGEGRSSSGENKGAPGYSSGVKTQGIGVTNPFKLVVIEPNSFDECPRLVDNLKSRKPVIINLEKIESDTARKIFDFLSGATYALNGNVQKVANNIFVFAPENVDISANIEHKAIDFAGNPKSLWR